MKIVIGILSFLILSSKAKDCEMLPDGHYTLILARKPDERIHVKFNGDNFVQYLGNGDSVSAKIESVTTCMFKLHYLGQSMVATNNNIQKKVSSGFGDQCIEVKKMNRDTVSFRITYTGNLHITLDSGYYIKR